MDRGKCVVNPFKQVTNVEIESRISRVAQVGIESGFGALAVGTERQMVELN